MPNTSKPPSPKPSSWGERLATRMAGLVIRGIAAGYRGRARAAEGEPGPVLLQVNFRFAGDRAAFRRRMDGFAPLLAEVPGLEWKLWADDATPGAMEGTAGGTAVGIYLFRDRAALAFYLDEMLGPGLGSDPLVSDMVVRTYDVLPHASRLTRGIAA